MRHLGVAEHGRPGPADTTRGHLGGGQWLPSEHIAHVVKNSSHSALKPPISTRRISEATLRSKKAKNGGGATIKAAICSKKGPNVNLAAGKATAAGSPHLGVAVYGWPGPADTTCVYRAPRHALPSEPDLQQRPTNRVFRARLACLAADHGARDRRPQDRRTDFEIAPHFNYYFIFKI